MFSGLLPFVCGEKYALKSYSNLRYPFSIGKKSQKPIVTVTILHCDIV